MRLFNLTISSFLVFTLTVGLVNANTEKINVVCSFSILEDLVKVLGGQHIQVTTLVSRNSDAHIYQPKPSDTVALTTAELLIFNGLDFEGWMNRLIETSGYKNKVVIASLGVDKISLDNQPDPHAWQSFKNIRIYINNISESLIYLRPEYKESFLKLKQQYLSELEILESSLSNGINSIPLQKRIVVTSHDAFGYLGREFDIQFIAPVGLSIEVEASAEDVAKVIDQIRNHNVQALFIENITNPRLLERIAAETGVGIGGLLYSDALSSSDGPANTYLNMMKHNLESLITAFKSQ